MEEGITDFCLFGMDFATLTTNMTVFRSEFGVLMFLARQGA
jgi:hypothetical protein